MVFTGIVECMGVVTSVSDANGGREVVISDASKVLSDVSLGDSIAVDGICLTVTSFDAECFTVGVAPETRRKTNIDYWRVGYKVNLERAVNSSKRYGGHIVQGHVDRTVLLENITKDPPNSLVLTLSVPIIEGLPDILKYVVAKGYVCLNGTSLTVVDVDREKRCFSVMLVAYTQKHVNLVNVRQGEMVNIEVDEMGKYVEGIVSSHLDITQDSPLKRFITQVVNEAVDRRFKNHE